jgi:hypothetical protein
MPRGDITNRPFAASKLTVAEMSADEELEATTSVEHARIMILGAANVCIASWLSGH